VIDFKDKRIQYLFLLVFVSFPAVLMFLMKGPLICVDWPLWISALKQADQGLVSQQRWFWPLFFPKIYAGIELGVPYSTPLILPWLLSRLFCYEVSIKLSFILSLFALTIGWFRFISRYYSFQASFVSTIAYLLICSHVLISGLWYNVLSLGLAFLFIVEFDLWLNKGIKWRWFTSVILFTLVIYTHPLGWVVCFGGIVGMLVFNLFEENKNVDFKKYIGIVLLFISVISLSFPQFSSILAKSPCSLKLEPGYGFNLRALLPPIWACLLVLPGLCYWKEINSKLLSIILVIAVLSGLIIIKAFSLFAFEFPGKSTLVWFSSRFSIVYRGVYILLIAHSVDVLLRKMKQNNLLHIFKKSPIHILTLLGIIIFCLFLFRKYSSVSWFISEKNINSAVLQDMKAAWQVADDNIDSNETRVYLQDLAFYANIPYSVYGIYKGNYNPTHIVGLMSYYTDLAHVNGWCFYADEFSKRYINDGDGIMGCKFNKLKPSKIDRDMRLLNCKLLIIKKDDLENFLDSRCEFLTCIYRGKYFNVYSHNTMYPAYAWTGDISNGSLLSCKNRYAGLDYIISSEKGYIKGQEVTFSFSHRGGWEAFIEDEKLEISTTPDMLMSVTIPRDTSGPVNFKYKQKNFYSIYFVLFGILIFLFRLVCHMFSETNGKNLVSTDT